MQEEEAMIKIVHMTVNGKAVELGIDEKECLTDTLRGRLGLTSVNMLHFHCKYLQK